MNKIAEKVVAAMTPAELEAVIDDHYRGEAQTLTTAAEHNVLKLAELRGRLTPEQARRWAEIKAEYVRQRRMGGAADDPVTRVVGTLSGLGAELGAIRDAVGSAASSRDLGEAVAGELRGLREAVAGAAPTADLADELRALREAILRSVMRTSAEAAAHDPERWLGPRLDALADSLRAAAASAAQSAAGDGPLAGSFAGAAAGMAIDAQQLLAQVRRIEQSLVPVVGAAIEQRAGDTLLANKMVQIIELLEQLDARLSAR
jgi:hypothetical protein